MPSAFDSTKQAAAFALLCCFLLIAPWLAHKTFLPGRKETYSSQSIRWEKFPWVQKFIYGETNDIDIAFIGSSHIGADLNTPYVQEKLNELVGHKTVVRSICFFYAGFDGLYFITRDLLAHRHVKTLVFYDECSGPISNDVHNYAPDWLRFGENGDALSGLSLRYQAIYYFATVIGMPRNCLELLSSTFPNDPTNQLTGPFAFWHASNPETTLGCFSARLGFNPGSVSQTNPNTNFIPFVPKSELTPADICIFTLTTATNFAFSECQLPINQIYFAKQFAALAKAHGCNLVAVHMPIYEERNSLKIIESRNWSELMQTDVELMGISSGKLFAGLSDFEIKQLYFDPNHLNVNGQKYFTSLVTPALLQLYEKHLND